MAANELADCPFYLVTRASLAITAHLKRALAAAGAGAVRPSYLGVLMSLWQEDGQRVVELGRRAGLEPSTMTGLLDRMERDGLVTRSPDPTDRRVLRVRLTTEGARVRPGVDSVLDASLEGLLNGVTGDDLESLKRSLRVVLTNTDRGET